MSTYAKRNSYVGPEDQRNIYKAGIDLYEPVTEISGTITPLTVLSPEVIEIRMRDGIQKSRRNTITMKNNHGEDMEMSLAFGIMRDGPPSTDDEESEEEGAHMAMTKKVILATRFSQIMGSNFLSKRVGGSEKEEVRPEAIAVQINEAVVQKKSKSRRRKRDGVGKSR